MSNILSETTEEDIACRYILAWFGVNHNDREQARCHSGKKIFRYQTKGNEVAVV